MKYPFKLSKLNIIYTLIVIVIIVLINIRIHGFDSYVIGLSLGSTIMIILIPILFALLFWFVLGRKVNGGTTTYNIILTIMLLGSISEFSNIIKDKQKPIDDLKNAVSDYKENTHKNPDSLDTNYRVLSNSLKTGIDNLIKTSIGDEKEVYLVFKKHFNKQDSINVEWNNSYNAFMEPRIFDFERLKSENEYEFQKKVIQDYINKSKDFKTFMQNRVEYLIINTKHLNQNNKAVIGFKKGFKKKDSIQKPIFIPYINAHIDYGEDLKRIIELLQQENGKWRYLNETIIFQNSDSQKKYEKLLHNATLNERITNELSDKLIEIM